MEKTEEHFQEAMMENKNSFHAVDPDGDGEREKNYNSKHTSWSVLKFRLDLCPKLINVYCIFKWSTYVLSTGHVTWDEYRVKFLASKGFNEKEIAEKIKNNEDLKLDEESKYRAEWEYFVILSTMLYAADWIKKKFGFSCLHRTAQEVLESLKDRWFQADNTPADQLLNEQEFLSFLHPEHSRGMLKYMVKEIVRDLGTSLLTQHLNPGC